MCSLMVSSHQSHVVTLCKASPICPSCTRIWQRMKPFSPFFSHFVSNHKYPSPSYFFELCLYSGDDVSNTT